jgi:hypothetical protein
MGNNTSLGKDWFASEKAKECYENIINARPKAMQ